ncbi:hypothetical protein V8E52_007731 [Russula decolorans]|jgi:hypothetical protein
MALVFEIGQFALNPRLAGLGYMSECPTYLHQLPAPWPFPHSTPSERKLANNPWPFMSSTGQATSSTSSTSNIQLITNALAEYAKITGVDLSKNPFAAAIEQLNSPEAILELLQEREKAFNEYRDNNRRLITSGKRGFASEC